MSRPATHSYGYLLTLMGPLSPKVLTVGIIVGIACQERGLDILRTILMSLGLNAAASQLAVLGRFDTGGLLEIMAIAASINIKHLPLALSLHEPMRHWSLRQKITGLLLLTDTHWLACQLADQAGRFSHRFMIEAGLVVIGVWMIGVGLGYGALDRLHWIQSLDFSGVVAISIAALLPMGKGWQRRIPEMLGAAAASGLSVLILPGSAALGLGLLAGLLIAGIRRWRHG